MREPVNQNGDDLIRMVDKWSNWLMIIVVVIPFIVSFGALQELASANGGELSIHVSPDDRPITHHL